MSLSCTVSEIGLQRNIGRKSTIVTYPTSTRRLRYWWRHGKFAEIFGIRKLESLGSYGAVFVILRLAILVLYRLVTDRRVDGRTHDSIYQR